MNNPEMLDFSKEFARTGYAHIAFSVGSKEKVDALTAELKADGYEVVSGPRTTGDGYYESCIVAIEGNNYGRGYKGTDFENRTGTVCAERLSGDIYE